MLRGEIISHHYDSSANSPNCSCQLQICQNPSVINFAMPPRKTSPTLKFLSFSSICDRLIDAIFKVEVSSFLPVNRDLHLEWKRGLADFIDLIPPPILKES